MLSDVPNGPLGNGEDLVRSLAASSIEAGRPVDWYEELYAAADAGGVAVPWDHRVPTPLLVDWFESHLVHGAPSGRAIVVGCAYGDDAELTASYGFPTTAFDISPSAVATAERRNPDSTVRYVQADLLDLPDQWRHGFDLVIECTTVQSITPTLHRAAAAAVASLCAIGGTVVVVARNAMEHGSPGPPWLLTAEEIHYFSVGGLKLELLETVAAHGGARWRAQLRRPLDRVGDHVSS